MDDPKYEPADELPAKPEAETDAERREIETEEEAARLGDFA